MEKLGITISNGRIEEYLCLFCIHEIEPHLCELDFPKMYRGFRKLKGGGWYEFCDRCGSHSLGVEGKKYYESVNYLAHITFGKVSKEKIELEYNRNQKVGIKFKEVE